MSEYMFNVVGPKTVQVFDTPEEALDSARRQLFMASSTYIEAREALQNGESFCYAYDFNTVEIIPVKKRKLEAEPFKEACLEWLAKTEWVQDRHDWPFPILGLHRADVLRQHIEHLERSLVIAMEALDFHQDETDRLVRELDVLINGREGAAEQAKLCDIIAQVEREGLRAQPVQPAVAQGEPVAFCVEFDQAQLGRPTMNRQEAEEVAALVPRKRRVVNLFREAPAAAINEQLLEALKAAIRLANEAFNHWDNDNDSKVGKILAAMAGWSTNYSEDANKLHAAIEEAEKAKGGV